MDPRHKEQETSQRSLDPEPEVLRSPIKFRPVLPSIPLVDRPRLLARLDIALEMPLTIFQSPAGFGKSTLLGQWRHELMRRGYAVPWLSLDRHDSDPTMCALSILGALDAGVPGPEKLLRPGQATDSETLFAQIVHALAGADRPVTFFLDDYHFAEGREVDLLVQRLLRALPPHVHLIVATRTRPGLGLPELQASGRLLHLKAEQLRFEAQESRSVLESSFGPDEIKVLADLPTLLVPWLREVAEAVHAAYDATLLTPREREVFELLRQGQTNKRIARALGITDHAVKFHLKNIFRKLGLRGRREVTAMGARPASALTPYSI